MAGKVIVIGVLLIFATSLLVSKPIQASKSKSNSRSGSSEAADFPCLDNELESCRLKRKTLSRLRVSLEDLQNANSQVECQDRCESAVGKRGRRKHLEQCNCLCNYYSICLGSIGDNGSGTAEGSGVESTKTKSRKSKKSRSKTDSGSDKELGSGRLGGEEDDTSKSKKNSKTKGSKSKKH